MGSAEFKSRGRLQEDEDHVGDATFQRQKEALPETKKKTS